MPPRRGRKGRNHNDDDSSSDGNDGPMCRGDLKGPSPGVVAEARPPTVATVPGETLCFAVAHPHAGARLDSALPVLLSVSRSQAQRYIRDGFVTIDGAVAKKPGAVLRHGQSVGFASQQCEAHRQAAVQDPVMCLAEPIYTMEVTDIDGRTVTLVHPPRDVYVAHWTPIDDATAVTVDTMEVTDIDSRTVTLVHPPRDGSVVYWTPIDDATAVTVDSPLPVGLATFHPDRM